MVTAKRSLKDVSIYMFGQIFNLVAPFIVIPYLISVCGIENFGKSSVALAIMFFLIVFIDYGTDIIGVKNISINRESKAQLKEIFCTVFLARFLLLITVVLLATIVTFSITYFRDDWQLYIFSFTILIGHFFNSIWYFQGIENYKWVSYLTIASKIFYLVFVFLFVRNSQDFILINFFTGIGMILSFIVGTYKVFSSLHIKKNDFSFRKSIVYIQQEFTFCISQMFLSIKNYFPIVIVSFFGGFNMAGYYKIIEQIILPIRTYLQVFFRFFYPKLSYKMHHNLIEGRSFWKVISLANAILISVLLVIIFFSSTYILSYFNIHLQELNVLSILLKWFLLYPVFFFFSFVLELLYLSVGEKKFYINSTIISVLFSLFCMIILIQLIDIYGILLALILSEIVLIVLYLVKLRNTFIKSIKNEN